MTARPGGSPIEEACRLDAAGVGLAEIAAAMGVDVLEAYRRIKAGRSARPRSAEKVAEARRLYGEGDSLPAIGRRLGASIATVWKWIGPDGRELGRRDRAARGEARRRRLAGLALARQRRRESIGPRNRSIRELWREGWTGPELAHRFGLTPGRIWAICRDLGRPDRTGREALSWPHPRRRFVAPMPPPPAPPARGPEDARDRLGPGYGQSRKGEAHGRSKLDAAAVVEMRRLYAGGATVGELAGRFGVSANTAGYAIRGVTWGHLPGAIVGKGGRR